MPRDVKPPVNVGDRFIDYRNADVVMRAREIFDYGENPFGRWPRRIRAVLLEPVGWAEGRHRLLSERTLMLEGHTELVRETPDTVRQARHWAAIGARRLT